MNPIVDIDDVSLLATCRVKGTVQDLARSLERKGYVTRMPSKKDLPLALALPHLEVVSISLRAKGKILQTKCAPRSATGPEFKKIFLQSPSPFGTPETVVLRIRTKPEHTETLHYFIKRGTPFLTELKAGGIRAEEFLMNRRAQGTRFSFHLAGKKDWVEAQKELIARLVKKHGGRSGRGNPLA